MAFRVRRLSTGKFAVDNGDQAPLLDLCPCCGLTFDTMESAKNVIDAINRGPLDFGTALEAAEMWRPK